MSDATESTPLTGYGVRKCRGHWHLVNHPSGEDIAVEGDPFPSLALALNAADRLNNPPRAVQGKLPAQEWHY